MNSPITCCNINVWLPAGMVYLRDTTVAKQSPQTVLRLAHRLNKLALIGDLF